MCLLTKTRAPREGRIFSLFLGKNRISVGTAAGTAAASSLQHHHVESTEGAFKFLPCHRWGNKFLGGVASGNPSVFSGIPPLQPPLAPSNYRRDSPILPEIRRFPLDFHWISLDSIGFLWNSLDFLRFPLDFHTFPFGFLGFPYDFHRISIGPEIEKLPGRSFFGFSAGFQNFTIF